MWMASLTTRRLAVGETKREQNRNKMPAVAELMDQWREATRGTPLEGASLHYADDLTTNMKWESKDGKRIK